MEIIKNSFWLNMIISIAIIIVGCAVLIKLWSIIYKGSSKRLNSEPAIHRKFINQMVKGLIYVIAVYMIMEQIPAFTGIANVLVSNTSLLVVVLGFAAQESLGDVINGLFISLFKPFEIGDRVRLVSANITGNIEDITLRHVIIRTIDNKSLVIPNSVMNKEIIENTDLVGNNICNFLDLSVSYESDIDTAIEIIQELVRNHKYFLDYRSEEDKKNGEPDVKVLVRELGDSGVHLRCHVWTEKISENFQMCSDIRRKVIERFKEAGIKIPYPHVEVINGDGENE